MSNTGSACAITRARGPMIKCLTIIQIKLELEMLVFEERGKLEYPEKNPLGARKRTNNKLNSHMTPGPGIKPGTHWCSHHCATLLPIFTKF